MELDDIINHFSDKNAIVDLSQKYYRRIVASLPCSDQGKIRKIACQLIATTNNRRIINNAIKLYASTLGKKIIDNYKLKIEKEYPKDYEIFKKIGVFAQSDVDNVSIEYYGNCIQLLGKFGAEFHYIRTHVLDIFPGRINLAKQLMFLLNNLTEDETILLFEYLSILLHDDIENIDDLSEAIKIFRWMRLDDEIEIEVTRNLTGLVSWLCHHKGNDKEQFKFKIIFLSNLLATSRIAEFTDYKYMCPIDVTNDAIFINAIENSIIDHLFFTSNNNKYIECIFSFDTCEQTYSEEKIKAILHLIDSSKIEISFKKLQKKKNKAKKSVECTVQNHYPDIELASVCSGEYEQWIDDAPQTPISKNSVNLRPNQQVFRNSVMDKYGACCSVCSIDILELIEAAHIIPKKDRGTDLPENGLPLCVLHHKAYDANLFCIHPDTLAVAAHPTGPTLEQLLITKEHINRLASPSRDVLAWRWNTWVDLVKEK